MNLIQLCLLLFNSFLSAQLFTFIHPGSSRFLNHGKNLTEKKPFINTNVKMTMHSRKDH